MYKKVVIIYDREFTSKEYIKNSISDFINKKIKIEIWIVKELFNKEYKINKSKIIFDKNIDFKFVTTFEELKILFDDEKLSSLFDLRIKLNIKNIKFFKFFFQYNFDYIIFPALLLSNISFHYDCFLKLQNLYIFIYFFWKKIKIKKCKYIYKIANKFDIKNNLLVSKNSFVIEGHHADYDKFLKFKKKVKLNTKKYFIFVDQNVPFHPDLKDLNKNDIDNHGYYISIKSFLDKTKKNLELDYFICPHPRTDLKNLEKFFDKTKIKKNTLEAIYYSEFILCHDSTASNFGILFNKPIISIFNSQLANSKYNHLDKIKNFCERANIPLKNIDIDSLDASDLKIFPENNINYIKNYISTHKENKTRIDILMEKINFNE